MIKINWRTFVSAFIGLTFVLGTTATYAETLDSARQQLNQTSDQIDQLQAQADAKAAQANTLSGEIAAMDSRIQAVQQQIDDTQSQIDSLNAQIAVVEDQMAAKKAVLDEDIKAQYYNPQPTTFEALVSADSLGNYLDQKEYLTRTQDKITQLMAEIEAIKKTLDDKKADLTKMQDQLKSQQDSLNAQRAAENDLLAKTQGEEANYQALLAQAYAAQDRLSSTIAKLMGDGPLPSKGHISAGDVIGREGSTGFSTGPHVHFGTYVNQSAVNPHQFLNDHRVRWPLANFVITQEYGPASWSNSHYTFHDGIDIDAGYGAPVLAACSGNIIMNSFQPDGFGHYIVIDCGGGLWALAGHMQI